MSRNGLLAFGLFLFMLGIGSRASAQTIDWVPCADEGGACTIPPGIPYVLVRYGANQSFFIRMSSFITREDCNDDEFGDPSPGNSKSCAYRPVYSPEGLDGKLPNISVPQGSFIDLSKIPNPTLIGYIGGNGATKYLYFSTPTLKRVLCADQVFGDPAYGSRKACGYTSYIPEAPSDASWKTCAAEGQTCAISDSIETVYVRYGVPGKNWSYYLAAAPSLPCGNDTFRRGWYPFAEGYPPPRHDADPDRGQSKFCQILAAPTVELVVGRWKLVANAIGGGNISHSVSSSVTGSRSDSRSESFSHSFTVTAEKESGGPPEVGRWKVSAAYTFGHTDTTEVTNTLSRERNLSTTVNCPAGDKSSQLFQWGVDIEELCYVSGNCKTSVETLQYLCAKDQPPSYRPLVAPSLCGDSLCLTLSPDKDKDPGSAKAVSK